MDHSSVVLTVEDGEMAGNITVESGQDVDVDDRAAVQWFQKAAEGGHTLAQFLVGQRYMQGLGVEKNEALKWYRDAEAHGPAGMVDERIIRELEESVKAETKEAGE